ncbi:MAG: heme ABC exporter ATP-binding protein CcmA [Chloroflexi bacterium]|nr:heme ABC exporter ATP-binding protein CcmA [Chloroflexota bacterium]
MSDDINDIKYAIEAKGLSKSFGGLFALKGIDLSINEGECVALFGPNGAGKTTLIKVLTTLSRPANGKVLIAGEDIKKNAVAVRRRIGVVSHQTFLYDNLTAYENLKFYGKMYDVPDLEQRIVDVITKVGLESRLRDRVGIFSRGMQQRLSIARAILHDPPIMLLDEPETGLDEQARSTLSELLKTLVAGNRTVLLTTHNLEWGFALADRLAILVKGKIVYEDSKQSLDMTTFRETYNRCVGARS